MPSPSHSLSPVLGLIASRSRICSGLRHSRRRSICPHDDRIDPVCCGAQRNTERVDLAAIRKPRRNAYSRRRASRSEERRVGKECVSKWNSRGTPDNEKKKQKRHKKKT